MEVENMQAHTKLENYCEEFDSIKLDTMLTGKRIKATRKQKNITQEKLADMNVLQSRLRQLVWSFLKMKYGTFG